MTAEPETSTTTGLARLVDVLSQRLQAGETLALSAALRDHPEHAEDLRRLLPALGALNDLVSQADARPTPAEELGPLGDFRLIREIGRGGMGVVYEAEQISLRRRVALKVLPLAATLDSRQLQRFRHEAQAAALLHHPNIVPVHAVGCDRGVHYYAMQFIEGRTLAETIRELRSGPPARTGAPAASTARGASSPTPWPAGGAEHCRAVARLCLQAAEALEYAHQTGVIHRDIKPANLLLDSRGELWVTDFGLALVRGHPELTVTGDLLGTLRYMSPEQARARPGIVDHRTDVYSLGATLYELLTLELAVPGDDRATVLQRITQEEPIRPKRLNPAVPADLETVVLKAMARSRDERYASARDFADDLRRFLDGQPVRARRVTGLQRFQKWAGRHRRVLMTLAIAMAAAGAGVVLGSLSYAHHQRVRAEEENAKFQIAARNERAATLKLLQAKLESARTTRLLGKPGYHDTYISALSHAVGPLPSLAGVEALERRRYLDDYGLHLARVRRELLAGLGDPVGILPGTYTRGLDWGAVAEARPSTTALTPDGRWKAEWDSPAREIKHFAQDGEPGKPVARSACPLGNVVDLKLSPDGRLLIAGCEQGFVVWDLPGLTIRTCSRGSPAWLVAIDPSSRRIAVLRDRVELWDANSNQQLREYPRDRFTRTVGFSHDGKYLLIGGEKPAAWPLRDTETNFHLDGHEGRILTIMFSPDGRLLASVGIDRTIRLWHVEGRKPVRQWTTPGSLTGALAFSPNGQTLAAGDDRGRVRLLDLATGAESLPGPPAEGPILKLQFTPDGSGLLAATGPAGLFAWKMPRLNPTPVKKLPEDAKTMVDLAIHPRGDAMVYLTGDGLLYRRSLDGHEPDRCLLRGCGAHVASLGFDQAGDRVTLMLFQGLASLNWQTGTVVKTVDAFQITHSPDGRWAAATADGRAISVCDGPSGSLVFTLPPERSEISALAWTPGSRRRLAVGLTDGDLAVWDIDHLYKRFDALGLDPQDDVAMTSVRLQVDPPPSVP